MSNEPTPPASDESDPEQRTTPAGQVSELEDKIEETGADLATDTATTTAADPTGDDD
jgi:hypothetical protein